MFQKVKSAIDAQVPCGWGACRIVFKRPSYGETLNLELKSCIKTRRGYIVEASCAHVTHFILALGFGVTALRTMRYLFESWASSAENWAKSSSMPNVTSTSGTTRKDVKKWVTKTELIRKLREIRDASGEWEGVRPHPDSPDIEARTLIAWRKSQ